VCGKSLLVLFTSLLPFMERSTIEDFPYNITEIIGKTQPPVPASSVLLP
jgi:hypothetical protein